MTFISLSTVILALIKVLSVVCFRLHFLSNYCSLLLLLQFNNLWSFRRIFRWWLIEIMIKDSSCRLIYCRHLWSGVEGKVIVALFWNTAWFRFTPGDSHRFVGVSNVVFLSSFRLWKRSALWPVCVRFWNHADNHLVSLPLPWWTHFLSSVCYIRCVKSLTLFKHIVVHQADFIWGHPVS